MRSAKATKRVLGVMLVLAMVLVMLPLTQVQAASFSGGRGTKSNPYIVTTADQFNSIRDNLSAHYKLGANIDLSKFSNWKAIGTWAKAFTGSLVCDTDAAGKPLYAITGLKCTVTPNDPLYGTPDYRYGDFKDDGTSGWEAGLFGVTNKATFKNIIVLNATIVNNCRGKSQQETYKGQVVNNPCYQMCGGVLAGAMIATEATGCGVTGTVSGSSNMMGGFAGVICGNSEVNRCYAIVDITNTGEWGTGGFVGFTQVNYEAKYQKNTEGVAHISECFASGKIDGEWCGTGGFVGGMEKETKIENCYCEGYVAHDQDAYSFAGEERRGSANTAGKYCTNVYTTSGLGNLSSAQTLKGNPTCFVATEKVNSQAYASQNGFTAADKATIDAFFSKLDVWTVGSGYPQLKNVVVIKSLSDLGTPSASTPTPTDPPSGNGGNSGNSGNSGSVTPVGPNDNQPDVTDPEATGSIATGPDATGPDATGPDATGPDANGSGDGSGSGDDSTAVNGEIQVVTVDISNEMTTAEYVLIIVLSVIIVGAVVASVCVIVSSKKRSAT